MPKVPFQFLFESEDQRLKHEATQLSKKIKLTKQKALKKDVLICMILDLNNGEFFDFEYEHEEKIAEYTKMTRAKLIKEVEMLYFECEYTTFHNEHLKQQFHECFGN